MYVGAYSCLRFDRPFPTEYGPFCYLPFDAIGARHPGIGAPAGSSIDLEWSGNLAFSFDFWSAGPSTTPDSCHGYVLTFMSGLIVECALPSGPGSRIKFQTSYRDAGELNNRLGPYPIGNGLSKRKQLQVFDS